MGDEFTAEELEILGESSEESAEAPESLETTPETPGEGTETETIPEGQEEEAEVETPALDEILDAETAEDEQIDELEDIPEDGKIPYNRFAKVYGKSKEYETKLDLLKRENPNAYYDLFPDQRPAADTTERPPAETISLDNLEGLRVTGGEYHGMTLAEVRAADPGAANQLENAYLRSNMPGIVKAQVQEALRESQEEGRQSHIIEENLKEIGSFKESRSQEFFGKPMSELLPIQAKKIEKLADQCVEWGAQNKRGGGVIEDIYFIMHRDRDIARAKEDGAGALINSATKGARIKSISTGGSDTTAGGFDNLLDMTPDQVSAKIENMPDAQFAKLMRDGSQELRDKHPGWPWE